MTEGFQVVAAAKVFEVCVCDGEVGSKHGGCDFTTVVAVAHEAADEAWAVGWLNVLEGLLEEVLDLDGIDVGRKEIESLR